MFEAWNGAENLFDNGVETPLGSSESADATLARHDFAFVTFNALGLRPAAGEALATAFNPKSLDVARARRAAIARLNPHFVLLASLSYRNAPGDRLPEDSPLWLRDAGGARVPARAALGGSQFYLDYRKPQTQAAVAAHCRALIETKVFDGCMFDFWSEALSDDPVDPRGDFRVALAAKVRAAVGESAILVANTNDRLPEKSARYLNGMYMEGFGAPYFLDWRKAAYDLAWGAAHLHRPAITLLEGWPTDARGRAELSRMREVTTLSLTLSDGYVLYADRNQHKIDHAHDWYPFWRARLGRPTQAPRKLEGGGPYRREFEHGAAVFNPPGAAPATIRFAEERVSAATGQRGLAFTVAPADGDLFLRP
ncbi:MAG: hypothetical protein KGM15_13960 [Pseudomonadota bacterium]|nr:hypothetical protein [Pseudomonadota bacterium]